MRLRDLVLLPVIGVLLGAGVLLDTGFLSGLIDLLHRHSELALLVLAEAVILIGGRIDLSLESTAGLAPALAIGLVLPVAAGGLGVGLPVWLAIPLVLLIGAVVGGANGLMILQFRLPAFAVTLGMLVVLGGLHAGLAFGEGSSSVPASVAYLGRARWLGLPASIWICALLFAAAMVFLQFFRYGRAIYAIGGNLDAARAAGVQTKPVLWIIFVAGGVIASLAGLLGSVDKAPPGPSLIFMVLAAAMIGGVSLSGGQGTLFGALCGVLVIALLNGVLNAAGLGAQWLPAAHGAIILVAVTLTKIHIRRSRT
ncbi:ABC transporter permease [Allorhizocola rhizosphaerae]|uniref:ABC transporter permease n=1 Tax=Allorhizocola rhizosphaerae TaxID=1872709 RepID=UPI001FE99CED|nr:ABC transporter permease [Allorhizocola rhizosphaerae]